MNYEYQPRNRQGKWVKGYSKIKLVLVFAGVILTIALGKMAYDTLATASELADDFIKNPVVFKDCEPCNENGALERKISELKKQLLEDLRACESGGKTGVVVMDSNDYLSFGDFQWQRKSIQHYYKLFYNKDIDLREAGLLAFDAHPEVKLDDFTSRVIFETDKGIDNWRNCDKKLNIKSRVNIINQLCK